MRLIIAFTLGFFVTTLSYAQWQGTNPVWFTAGSVGVGTSSPSFKFHIRGSNPNSDLMTLGGTTTGNFALTSTDGGAYGLFGGVSSTGRAWLQAGRYDTNVAYDLLLQSSGGNVGIRTTNPQVKLDIGSAQNDGLQFRYDASANYRIRLTPFWNSSTDTRLDFNVERIAGQGFTTVMSVGYGNNVGIGTSTPEFKLHVSGQIASGYTYLDNTIDVENSYTRSNFGSNVYWDAVNNFWQVRPIGNNDFSAIVHPNCDGLAFIAAPSDGNVPKALTHGQFMAFEKMRISSNGNVGIGINSPLDKLHVYGNLSIRPDDATTPSYINFKRNDGWIAARMGQMYNQLNYGGHLIFETNSGAGATTLAERMRITYDGNVGIGTTTPGSFKLAVNGKIWTQEVNVAMTNPGPDYVFEKDYDLLSLTELETYITQHKHLPEVPSAKEMEANGLNLKEMNLLLLKKVEELTLHLIEQQKQISRILNENEKLNKVVTEIDSSRK